MIIRKEDLKEQLRRKFLSFLVENGFKLMSFCEKNRRAINEIEKRERDVSQNYKLIYNRLYKCAVIDLEFIQKLIDLIDKTQKVQVIREKVVIGKHF